ncbi:hypothetical protein CERSUDRAFT_76345 [Gelatoporia subvermispora B]|uniref:Uncharacterized protein n=1 Tax=Ceriporiopsis subvermispora (strain B) TaxID=914234 RepID=M2PD03_CERS8|nr:hypothetical protein CERSUDRAFT_76345 [Gelatoporia subvermispora B]
MSSQSQPSNLSSPFKDIKRTVKVSPGSKGPPIPSFTASENPDRPRDPDLELVIYMYKSIDKYYRERSQKPKEFYAYPLWEYIIHLISLPLKDDNHNIMEMSQPALDVYIPAHESGTFINDHNYFSPGTKLGDFVRSPGPQPETPGLVDMIEEDHHLSPSAAEFRKLANTVIKLYEAQTAAIPDFGQIIGYRKDPNASGFDTSRMLLLCEVKAMPVEHEDLFAVFTGAFDQIRDQAKHLFNSQCRTLNNGSGDVVVGAVVGVGPYLSYNEFKKSDLMNAYPSRDRFQDENYELHHPLQTVHWPAPCLRHIFRHQTFIQAVSDVGLCPDMENIMREIRTSLQRKNRDLWE